MNAHLSKPLNVPELMDTIRKFCDGKQMCQREKNNRGIAE